MQMERYKIKSNKMDIDEKINKMPFLFDWVRYKGKAYFASVDIEKSRKENKIKVDLCYCATKALGNLVEKTVTYRMNDFELYDNPRSI